MTLHISRRKFIGTTSAGVAAAAIAGSPAVFAQDDLPTVGVGSKDFTESVLLGEIMAQLLEDNGFSVERQLNLGGTVVAHEAMLNGDIDTYVEYTGTGLLAILGMDLPEVEASPEASPAAEAGATPESGGGTAQAVYDIVAEEYPKQFGVEWLEPWGFNNTYALAMRRDRAEELGLTKVSDLQGVAGDLTIGATQEAVVREDGIPGLEATYGIDFGDVVGLDPGLMYSAVDNGDVDIITAFATDGRIESMDLFLLEDDLAFYPPYYAAPVVRQDLLEEAPNVRDILNSVAGTLDDARMAGLNFQVDEEGQEVPDVARGFLTDAGLISGDN